MARPTKPPKGTAWSGPQIPSGLLHKFTKIDTKKEFSQADGGIYKTVHVDNVVTFQGIIMPLTNEDLQYLPEGTATVNVQKIYTNAQSLEIGQGVRDEVDGKLYTVENELTHSPIHGMKRYTVRTKGGASPSKP